ncbi:aldehyde dehydrogenase family protein [Desulfosarcina cetonica]|uniref:aldehyde dehydrogenase family protein n=1 Tax=Desulfosarcina cetonica TaxID=90730 RepID=UPI000ADDA500|nr:aldehyde dehydrogenase family protein [Desulfosarcina cetonica]
MEVFGTEIGLVLTEIRHHIKKLGKWARPTRVPTNLLNFGSRSRIYHQPFGVVLIMAPWNYPLQLALAPLVGAISAGNCAMLKPAHYASHVSELIRTMIVEVFDPAYVSAVTGDRAVNQALLEERFDLIFFTGSPSLGKIVMAKAARHLTPVVLELGGKSPCIVAKDAKIEVAAPRIAFGKFINAGQTCVAPDHLFVHRSVKAPLIAKIRDWIIRSYGTDPQASADFCRIINTRQFDRLVTLMRSAGAIVHGGRVDREDRYIEPTLIDDIHSGDPIMQEEIFGPLLPVIEFSHLDEVIDMINAGEKPLAMYFFGSTVADRDRLLRETSSGGGCINDTIMHLSNPNLPFGGVGNSGMGHYHGKFSFDTFSHHRAILEKTTAFNPSVAYPPYKQKLRFLRSFLS